jgi:hypothetical protein
VQHENLHEGLSLCGLYAVLVAALLVPQHTIINATEAKHYVEQLQNCFNNWFKTNSLSHNITKNYHKTFAHFKQSLP